MHLPRPWQDKDAAEEWKRYHDISIGLLAGDDLFLKDLYAVAPSSLSLKHPSTSNMSPQASFTDKLALGEAKRGENKRRVIVTGGSGKLGRSTVRYLADEGWEVISVDTRRPPGISEDGKSGLGGAYRLVEIDLEDMGAVIETFLTTVSTFARAVVSSRA